VWSADGRELQGVVDAFSSIYSALLTRSRHEPQWHAYCEMNPTVLVEHLTGGYACYVISQKRLGGEFVTDFETCQRDSNGDNWIAVELRPRGRPLTKRAGQLPRSRPPFSRFGIGDAD
jgi:hypothetical protein